MVTGGCRVTGTCGERRRRPGAVGTGEGAASTIGASAACAGLAWPAAKAVIPPNERSVITVAIARNAGSDRMRGRRRREAMLIADHADGRGG